VLLCRCGTSRAKMIGKVGAGSGRVCFVCLLKVVLDARVESLQF